MKEFANMSKDEREYQEKQLEHMIRESVVYSCDPTKNKLCKKTECFLYGGHCVFTLNPQYAKTNMKK